MDEKLQSLCASSSARPKEPYVGPALEYIDRAVSWAEEWRTSKVEGCAVRCLDEQEFDLQIVLDLHGCPGGESPEAGKLKWRVLFFRFALIHSQAPCGRRQRPESRWNWKHWDFQAQ